MFYGQWKNNIFWLQTFTKSNIEPHQNSTGSYEKSILQEVLDEPQETEYQKVER